MYVHLVSVNFIQWDVISLRYTYLPSSIHSQVILSDSLLSFMDCFETWFFSFCAFISRLFFPFSYSFLFSLFFFSFFYEGLPVSLQYHGVARLLLHFWISSFPSQHTPNFGFWLMLPITYITSQKELWVVYKIRFRFHQRFSN